MSLVRSLPAHQAGPEKPTVTGSVVSVLPRTQALCELKGQTQVSLSGRGLGNAQSQSGTSHLTAWASPKPTMFQGFFLPRILQFLAGPPSLGALRPGKTLGLRMWAQSPGAPSLLFLSLCAPPHTRGCGWQQYLPVGK